MPADVTPEPTSRSAYVSPAVREIGQLDVVTLGSGAPGYDTNGGVPSIAGMS